MAVAERPPELTPINAAPAPPSRSGLAGLWALVGVIGFSMTMLLVVYHVVINWLGTNGNAIAHLPSYMRP
jgi:hypothetical protein